jgi:hypothetical protein
MIACLPPTMPDDEVAEEGVEQDGDSTSTTEPSILTSCGLVVWIDGSGDSNFIPLPNNLNCTLTQKSEMSESCKNLNP